MATEPDPASVVREIVSASVHQGVDPLAVLSVASHEGSFDPSAPGHYDPDQQGNPGWSYGPFQLRSPGALPISSAGAQGPGEAFAWSQQGIDYAVGQIAQQARGIQGIGAVEAIVSKFERPADPGAEVERAAATYRGYQSVSPPLIQNGQLSPGAASAIIEGSFGTQSAGAGILGTGIPSPGTPQVVTDLGGAVQGAGQGVSNILNTVDSVPKLINFVTSWQFAEILGGFLLLIVGLILLGRQFGLNVSTPLGGLTPASRRDSYASAQPTSREGTPRRTKSYTLEADRPAPERAPANVDYGEVPF